MLQPDIVPQRNLEGPPRLVYEQIERRKLGDNPGIIGYISMREWLMVSYGYEGVGWDAYAGRYDDVQQVAAPLSSDVLTQGSQVLTSIDLIDVVVYPDGDRYHEEKYR